MRKKNTRMTMITTERPVVVVDSEEEEAVAEASDNKMMVADVVVDNITEMMTITKMPKTMMKDTVTLNQFINKLLEEEIRRRI